MILDQAAIYNDMEDNNKDNRFFETSTKCKNVNEKASAAQHSSTVYSRHCNLLTQLKVSVKRVMEEAATKKLIYIDCSTVNGLCGAIEICVLDNLQRRTIGLFEDLHSIGLLKKISKDCEAASFILQKMKSFSNPAISGTNGRFFSENESFGTNQKSPNTISLPNTLSGIFNKPKPSLMKYLWIKLSLVEKKLVIIIDHLMKHHSSFYNETSIMSGSLSGTLFIDLLAGPCSLDFSLVKPSDHLWADPDASELLDRHNIHSKGSWALNLDRNIYRSGLKITCSNKNRPNLKIQHHTSPSLKFQDPTINNSFGNIFNMTSQPISNGSSAENKCLAKDYVESLHQNMKNILLYGKNNVIVQPKDDLNEMQGYLSLHQTFGDKLRLKWTPNQLMNYQTYHDMESMNEADLFLLNEKESFNCLASGSSKGLQWDSALLIKLENIVYLHVHQNEDKSGKITLVCQDGVQHPPLYFPSGCHLLQFLTCLENGLLPTGRLEPPLLQINDGEKDFPKITRRRSNCSLTSEEDRNIYKSIRSKGFSLFDSFNKSLKMRSNSSMDKLIESGVLDDDDCNLCQSDFVFRIMYEGTSVSTDPGTEETPDCFNSPSTDSCKDDKNGSFFALENEVVVNSKVDPLNDSLNSLCTVMRRQILSRAFYGWYHYYRNLKTVRTKCISLVLPGSVQCDVPCDATEGLTVEIWNRYKNNKDLSETELYRYIYFGGCAESLRNEIWPRMLGHYEWCSTDNSEINLITELNYEKTLSQWKAIEVIISQKENECQSQSSSNSQVKPNSFFNYQTEMTFNHVSNDKSKNSSPHKDSIINISNCDLRLSKGFYSSDNSIDAGSSTNQDMTFQDDQLLGMADNMHRIDKDVERCDRNYPYFSCSAQHKLKGKGNLKKLRNIMITWVWENMEIGYVQGMCDLLAPLLVVLDNEALTHACFSKLMKRMIFNFPQMGSKMDENLKTMALLLQIIDGNLYDHMCHDGEITSLYVTYRWFLLDFKRELSYADVFSVWETIWSANHVASSYFNLFLALSLLHYYRDIILDNNMEYTDIIKFFNEMAEKHQVQNLLYIARTLIETIRDLLKPR